MPKICITNHPKIGFVLLEFSRSVMTSNATVAELQLEESFSKSH